MKRLLQSTSIEPAFLHSYLSAMKLPASRRYSADLFPPPAPVASMPAAAPRRALHPRRIVYDSFARDDGLFDIEGRIIDTKAYRYEEPVRGVREPGDVVHEMWVRLTIDGEMTVRDIHVAIPGAPYPTCPEAQARFRTLLGLGLARGWRRAVDERTGGTLGCTHVREMLYQMPTVAYQSLGNWSLRTAEGFETIAERIAVQPRFIDGCHSWRADGPIVAVLFPEEAVPTRDPEKP